MSKRSIHNKSIITESDCTRDGDIVTMRGHDVGETYRLKVAIWGTIEHSTEEEFDLTEALRSAIAERLGDFHRKQDVQRRAEKAEADLQKTMTLTGFSREACQLLDQVTSEMHKMIADANARISALEERLSA